MHSTGTLALVLSAQFSAPTWTLLATAALSGAAVGAWTAGLIADSAGGSTAFLVAVVAGGAAVIAAWCGRSRLRSC